MIYVSCKNCDFVLETTASWRVSDEAKEHVREFHRETVQAMFDEEERYNEAVDKIPTPKLDWSTYLMVESLPKKVGRKEYKIE
jgi:hypothetical protein